MKKIIFPLYFLLLIGFFACSSDSTSTTNEQGTDTVQETTNQESPVMETPTQDDPTISFIEVFATAIALGGSVIMPRPDIVATLAVLWGLWVGLACMRAYGVGFTADGLLWQKAGRIVLGGIVNIGIFGGLRAIFPDEGESLYIVFRFVRYGLIGLFVGYAGPWLFTKIGLAGDYQS